MDVEANDIWPGVKLIRATIVCLAAVLAAILFAYLLLYSLIQEGYYPLANDKYEFFVDLLIINLSILAVIFAAIVFWIHLYITERVKNAVEKPLKERDVSYSNYVQGLTLLNDGYTCWLIYETMGNGLWEKKNS